MAELSGKRILFVSDYLQGGGAEIVMHQLIAGLESAGMGIQTDIFYGVKDNRRKTGNPLSYIYSRHFRKQLKIRLEEFKPDVIHFLNYYHILSPSVLDAASVYKKGNPHVKVVYTAHDFHLISPSSGLTSFKGRDKKLIKEPPSRYSKGLSGFSLYFRRWDHRGFIFSTLKLFQWVFAYRWHRKDQVFDHLISPGSFMLETLKTVYPREMLSLIRNPHPDFPSSAASFPPLRSGETLKLVFGGRLGPEKGLREFISSIDSSLWKEITFDIYGTGPEDETLRAYIIKNNLEDVCRLKGYLSHEELLEKLPSYHALVLPSLWYENAPLSIVEGAVAGLYLLVSCWGGVGETASFCGGEVLITPDSPESVSSGVRDIIESAADNGSPERNFNVLRESYSLETFITKHLKLYEVNTSLR
ncbi:MAG: glycosyltransferase [Spirochaetales bacterium]|nr:glycosyltransferase [Spirochaetales bacterium]